jgi:hypothetical protein
MVVGTLRQAFIINCPCADTAFCRVTRRIIATLTVADVQGPLLILQQLHQSLALHAADGKPPPRAVHHRHLDPAHASRTFRVVAESRPLARGVPAV